MSIDVDVFRARLEQERERGRALLEVQAAFRTAWGSGRRNEIVLWQRVTRLDWIPGLLVMEVPEHLKAPGTWMHDALQLRDQWESRLLRSTRWSPIAWPQRSLMTLKSSTSRKSSESGFPVRSAWATNCARRNWKWA